MAPTFRSDNSPYPTAVRQLYADEGADPAYARAVDAISRDPALAPLLGDGVRGAGEQSRALIPGAFIRTDTANAWLIRSHTHLPGSFVHTAARYVLARGLPTDSIAPLLDELARVVARVRRLMAGEPDDAAVLMAFHGLRVADGVTLQTPWGSLRAASSFEHGQRLFGGPSPSAILETTVPVRWTLAERQVRINTELAAIATHPDLLGLTVLLAVGRGTPLQWLWQATLVPLQILTNGYVGRAISAPWAEPPAPDPLTEEQADALVTWANRIARSYHPSVAVAMRRTLSAVAESRFSPEDALIDAVIAWENLFGTGGRSEMMFRITTVLTILLEPEPSARPELRSGDPDRGMHLVLGLPGTTEGP